MFLKAGADPNYVAPNLETALLLAVDDCANPQVVKALIDAGANVNVRDQVGYTPLMWAAYRKDPSFARLLIEAGANVDYVAPDGNTALTLANGSGSRATLTLIEHAAQSTY